MRALTDDVASGPADGPRPAVVATARGEVECTVLGGGAPLLALHGAMGGWDQSLLLARALGAVALGHRAVCVSRPGYLGTPLGSGRTPEEQADLYAALLDRLGVDRAVVAAVSGGGPSALAFALRHPERCRALVLVSAASARMDVPLPLAWYVLKLAARIPPLAALMARQAGRDPDAAAARSIPDAALRARTLEHPEAGPLLRALQASTGDRMALRIRGTENDIATTRRELPFPLERVHVPVLAIHGTGDTVAPFAMSRALSERVPGAELLAIEGGGHVALFTHLDAIRARVRAFLSAHP
jgi:pimeloyl-ACP methyl ester carboxylesterase